MNVEILDQSPVKDIHAGYPQTTGSAYLDNLERFKTIFRSPGIRPDIPQLLKAEAAGAYVTSALSFFLERCPATVIGVTGTAGKGTVCTLLAKALEASGFTVHLGGNIGTSPLTFLDDVLPGDIVVLEISSFQAMDLRASPAICAVLKTTSEHLNWHTDTGEYRMAKANLLKYQTSDDIVAVNADSEGALEVAGESRAKKIEYSLLKEVDEGIFLSGEQFVYSHGGKRELLPLTAGDVAMTGRFNLENIAAAILLAVSAGAGIRPVIESVAAFRGLPHRLELVAQKDDLKFYNDSYATRPDAAVAAIKAFNEPVALILGGSEKNAGFDELVEVLMQKKNIRAVLLIGATSKRIHSLISAAGKPGFILESHLSLESAMDSGIKNLNNSGIVLLSPACASFGMFLNYKDRGEKFSELAKKKAGSV
jgi:UDP-N-acetylmuramoylalanine--D-glutamate ligase